MPSLSKCRSSFAPEGQSFHKLKAEGGRFARTPTTARRPRHHALLGAALALAAPAAAQEPARQVPISDTEDASLDLTTVRSPGRLHPILGVDLRNGDFVRGTYDDDGAGLGRLPVHAQLGLVYELGGRNGGDAPFWLEARSSNGFHAPSAGDTPPRAWYESNNLVGLAARLAPGAVAAVTYTVKTSPNGVSGTTNELSGAATWGGKAGLAALHPGLAATWRPKGGGGLYTQASLAPGVDLGRGEGAPRLSAPLAIGVGWRGFYGTGSGRRLFGRAGLAWRHPLAIGATRLALRAELSALVRDRRLRLLDPAGSRQPVRPYANLALSYAY